ncbi:uncharacterized protein BT62DRAFT_921932 [Guyanagaster necrorhizus]|uniref:Uncharacterized protein n=1 Tax=Guyanagaster necrorhizus TaxID=856835 RepID=A0A9P7VMH7_9AGAR|nr:uncharacterized protein BT62DRAFT_921932 [Guyanagaster necrorhizus MCA 3950]KAG7443439.1 hypothetical protein BT62DRAFT_921932 [Guyanagaster necrorhizus MCA 3950]
MALTASAPQASGEACTPPSPLPQMTPLQMWRVPGSGGGVGPEESEQERVCVKSRSMEWGGEQHREIDVGEHECKGSKMGESDHVAWWRSIMDANGAPYEERAQCKEHEADGDMAEVVECELSEVLPVDVVRVIKVFEDVDAGDDESGEA